MVVAVGLVALSIPAVAGMMGGSIGDQNEDALRVGPEWKISSKSVAAEAVLDFMFWPGPERKIGWFLEPTYSYDFGSGHEKSLGVSVGLLIAIP